MEVHFNQNSVLSSILHIELHFNNSRAEMDLEITRSHQEIPLGEPGRSQSWHELPISPLATELG